MHHPTLIAPQTRRLRRRMAGFVARCAMGSWIVLAAMPVAVVVLAIA